MDQEALDKAVTEAVKGEPFLYIRCSTCKEFVPYSNEELRKSHYNTCTRGWLQKSIGTTSLIVAMGETRK